MFLSHDIGAISRDPSSDFWYSPLRLKTISGANVSSETAMSIPILRACVNYIASSIAKTPLNVYRRLPDNGGKELAYNHPLYSLFKVAPNEYQDAYKWKEVLARHILLDGNTQQIINTASNGQIASLDIEDPDDVKIELLGKHKWRYQVKQDDETYKPYSRGEIFHITGPTNNGIVGISPIYEVCDAIGEAIAEREYSSRFYVNDGTPGSVIEWENTFKNDDQRRLFRLGWTQAQTGVNRHKTAILENGMKFREIKVSNKDAQYIERRELTGYDMCRIYSVQPHKVGLLDHATFSNIEHQSIESVIDCLLPYFVMIEAAINHQLITHNNTFLAEFNIDTLLRGDTQTRYDAYGKAIQDGWMTRNEARKKENLNPLPGLNEPLQQLNMGKAREGGGNEREALLARNAAEVLAKKEIQGARAAIKKGVESLHLWANEFYKAHNEKVARLLVVEPTAAADYTNGHLADFLKVKDSKGFDELLKRMENETTDKLLSLGGKL